MNFYESLPEFSSSYCPPRNAFIIREFFEIQNTLKANRRRSEVKYIDREVDILDQELKSGEKKALQHAMKAKVVQEA